MESQWDKKNPNGLKWGEIVDHFIGIKNFEVERRKPYSLRKKLSSNDFKEIA